jgi:hypothetical protein
MIHLISSCDLGPTILTSLALHRCVGPSAPSLAQASPPHGPSLQSLRLALHTCNRSVEPNLILILATLVTWLHVMSHMQWAPSWHNHLWTNLLCISHNHILVHLSCHSITKTKQGPFTWTVWRPVHPSYAFGASMYASTTLVDGWWLNNEDSKVTHGDHRAGERVGHRMLRSVRCFGTYVSGAVGVC